MDKRIGGTKRIEPRAYAQLVNKMCEGLKNKPSGAETKDVPTEKYKGWVTNIKEMVVQKRKE
ncbi:hypothetical protein [Helicobacter bizzozeronii]|uniref:hypothetical protein n=1 Tax=Helicobacter bizzozeronii TaxID=56877 RepID=UPI00131524A0|nr:hypothetical protein [Helicobacter bizzozeronii]